MLTNVNQNVESNHQDNPQQTRIEEKEKKTRVLNKVSKPKNAKPKTQTTIPTKLKKNSNLDGLFSKYFGNEANLARAICQSESGLVYKVSATGDHGVCQINLYWNYSIVPGATRQEKINALKDPEINISVAKKIRQTWGNFNAWTDFRNGNYKRFL